MQAAGRIHHLAILVKKTHFVRETYDYQFAFQYTGILEAPMNEQLGEFRKSLYAVGLPKSPKPETWGDAFHIIVICYIEFFNIYL